MTIPDYLVDFFFSWDVQAALKLLLATALGFFIGHERKERNKPVGSRTCIIITVSATLLTLLSIEGFRPFFGSGNVNDPSRLAAQILSGIGFIGAGVIMRKPEDNIVVGITTAATIWLLTAIGIAIGLGQFVLAVTASVILVVSLLVPKNIKRSVVKRIRKAKKS